MAFFGIYCTREVRKVHIKAIKLHRSIKFPLVKYVKIIIVAVQSVFCPFLPTAHSSQKVTC